MKSPPRILCVSLACLLCAGCGSSPRAGGKQSKGEPKGERKAAEEAARAQRLGDLLDNGKKALEAKQFDDAVKSFEEALGLKDDPQASELLVQAQKSRDEVRKAAYDQAMLRGGQARKEENYPVAIAAFRDALGQLPNDKEAAVALQEAHYHDFLAKGRTAHKNEQYADAVKAFGEAVTRQPEDKPSRDLLKQAQVQRRLQVMGQGQSALKAKQYGEALQLFAEARDLMVDAEVTALLSEANFQAKLQLGRQRVEANQFAAAIADLEEAARLQPDHAGARELLQQAKQGKQRQDKTDYDRALAAGDAAMLRKDYQAATSAYREALAKQPQDGMASSKLAAAQSAKSKKDSKDSYDRHVSQGKTQVSIKNYALAEMEFRAALTDMPGDPEAQRLLQETRDLLQRAKQGKQRQDKADYDRALAAGDAAMLRKDYQAATSAYREALAKQPQDGMASSKLAAAQSAKSKKDSYDRHMGQGRTHLLTKNYPLAATEFQAALFDVPGDLEAQRLLQQARQKRP